MTTTHGGRRHWAARGIGIGVAASVLALQSALAHPVWAASGTFTQSYFSGSTGARPYWVYTPAGYTKQQTVPLVVMLHGCTQTPANFAAGTRMNDLADLKQFIVVYPEQTATYDAGLCWHWFLPGDQSRGSGEPSIIAGITQRVMSDNDSFRIDPHRVYVAGISAGAAMAVILGATYPDLYAAIGEESGLEYAAAYDQPSAYHAQFYGGPDPNTQGQAAYAAMGPYARVMPVIVFHGTGDNIVYPINGDQVVQQWMATDHRASASYNPIFALPSSTSTAPLGWTGRPYTVRAWNDAFGNQVQQYWQVIGMGHAWSGGSTAGTFTDPTGPSATDNMYAFFMAHSH
jgi:poly(hydroxyalkanoate) depolymerase family esterase